MHSHNPVQLSRSLVKYDAGCAKQDTDSSVHNMGAKNCFIMCVFVTLVKSAVKNKYSIVENQSTDEKKFSNDNKLTVFRE